MKKLVFFSLLLSLSLVVKGQFKIETGFEPHPPRFVEDIGIVATSRSLLLYVSEDLIHQLYLVYKPEYARYQYPEILKTWKQIYDHKRLYYVRYISNEQGYHCGDTVDCTDICFHGESIADRLVGLYEKYPSQFPSVRIMMDRKVLSLIPPEDKKEEYSSFPPPSRYSLKLICQYSMGK
jgi:hypothetical protein